jgi:hypothetical protein
MADSDFAQVFFVSNVLANAMRGIRLSLLTI